MTDRPPIPDLVRNSQVIAIGRNVPAAAAPRIGEAFVAGGVHVMELTLNEPVDAALRSIEALAAVADDLEALVGAGTVLSIGAAKRAVDAGARFIVSPHTDTELIAWCALSGVPCYPGALSPTEIHAAWAAGASAVKLFPAAAVGTGYLKQIAGPFPDIEFIPTGGVSAETAGDWIAAGAVAVGMGGWLIGDGEPAGITERSRQVVRAVSGR
jgi:2-dehydro-3-deoxyphosphogluconate aldolase/(4S)-4-hydroxy-2-oxoglutarate aldolase